MFTPIYFNAHSTLSYYVTHCVIEPIPIMGLWIWSCHDLVFIFSSFTAQRNGAINRARNDREYILASIALVSYSCAGSY